MPYPKNAHMKSPVIKPSCRNRVLELLKERDYTTRELGALLDRTPDAVAVVLRGLPGKAYISEWIPKRGSPEAKWSYGDKPHAAKPKPTYKKPTKHVERAQDARRLTSNYVTGERIWGI